MTNLKPCPCCGGEVHMITRPQIGSLSGDDGFLSTIKCLGGGDCGLEVSAWALKKAWAIESVTKKWNRRANAEVPRWIPVTERLPERADEVLIAYIEEYDDWTGDYAVSTATYMPRAGRWDYDHLKITHWMPLPKAPDLT